ncbi:MAG: GNAT family N-acetyltransferase [Anaerolineales bacterium]
MEIKQLTPSDLSIFKSLIDLFNLVFEEENPTQAEDAHLLKLLDNKSFIALVAILNGEVLGGLTAYELPMVYTDRSELFLYDMAVKTEYQRTGIGKKLIEHLKEICTTRGIETFFVMAHEEDDGAIEFYHATGGQSEKVMNFLYDTSKITKQS